MSINPELWLDIDKETRTMALFTVARALVATHPDAKALKDAISVFSEEAYEYLARSKLASEATREIAQGRLGHHIGHLMSPLP